MITQIRIPIIRCTDGVYLRWFFNGWHYFLFTNGYEITMQTENADTMVTKNFSLISRVERPTKITTKYSYKIGIEGITLENIQGFTGLLMAEKVEQYENEKWYEVDITRGTHLIQEEGSPGYILEFEVTRKELPGAAAVFQKTQFLYLGDQLCDLDDDEIIPINKQVNDIAEMKDRQSDFTGTFKIRKTRAMRLLFELSGESGSNTTFPYKKHPCRLIQDGIEIITGGKMNLDKRDDQYYYVSIYSGNTNFFSLIETQKITDLTLESMNHTWDAATMAASNAGDLDYIYPLLEPSDDAGMSPLTDTGSRVNLYGGWIWPFAKVKAIWDEIFAKAAFTVEGNILSDPTFQKLFMPIKGTTVTGIDKYLYSVYWSGNYNAPDGSTLGWPGAILMNGNENFRLGHYYLPFSATYKIKVVVIGGNIFTTPPTLSVYKNGVLQGTMTAAVGFIEEDYTYELPEATADDLVEIKTTAFHYYYYAILITEITSPKIGFSSDITMTNHLPAMTQTEFLKMVCNLFCLVPDVTSRDKKIRFWNYKELYDNIPRARDWSQYLSETEDETEFEFGGYAQRNILKYTDSKDVIPDNGKGTMQIDDETLELEKEILTLPLATCDEVKILDGINVSRIAFNKYDAKDAEYKTQDSIDPRIVYVSQLGAEKTFGISEGLTDHVPSGTIHDTASPKKASSIEVSFSTQVANYAPLSRMLTKTNLRREKFNLPVYEVAGLKHYIPIYLRQFNAYFYVNKINNYVPGRLCITEIIKL